MAALIFRKLRWKNFLSTGNRFIEMELDKSPTTLIVGKNGSGKSTVLDALTFALFGKPFRNINKPQLINSVNGGECLVEVEFDVGNTAYVVRRGIKPTVFEIIRNGKVLDQDSKAGDFQRHLEKNILNLNYKSFTQIVILGSASFVPFMQLKAADRREVVEDLLDITIFSAMNVVLKKHGATLRDEVRNIETEARILTEKVKMQKKYLADLSESVQKEIDEHKGNLAVQQEQFDTIMANIESLTQQSDMLKAELDHYKQFDTKRIQLADYESKMLSKKKLLNADIKFFQTTDDCPKCHQHLTPEFKETAIDEAKKNLNDVENAGKKLLVEIEKVQAKLAEAEKINEQVMDIVSKLMEEQSELKAVNAMMKSIKESIVKLESGGKDGDRREEHEKVLTELQTKLKDLATTHRLKIDEQRIQELASEMLKDTGIKTKIIRQYLPIINNLINKYLGELSFPVKFMLDENFRETIDSRFGDTFSYASFSEGQKMRVDLAVLFTWVEVARMKNSVNTNILFFDEVFDSSLDDEGTDDFMKIVNSFADKMNVFVISHKSDSLIDKFEQVITFEQHKGYSRMVTA